MWNVLDWILLKMNLAESDEEEENEEERSVVGKFSYQRHMFCKKLVSYDDAKEILRQYKLGAECVICFNSAEIQDVQGMLSYIHGGIYALEGSIEEVGRNVFAATHLQIKHY